MEPEMITTIQNVIEQGGTTLILAIGCFVLWRKLITDTQALTNKLEAKEALFMERLAERDQKFYAFCEAHKAGLERIERQMDALYKATQQ